MQSQLDPGTDTLIRTTGGRITFWSVELQRRYGFPADHALGQDSYKLLRTRHWQTRNDIEAVLATRSTSPLVQQSIQVFRRQLALLRSERQGTLAERLLTRLLREEEAKLASLANRQPGAQQLCSKSSKG